MAIRHLLLIFCLAFATHAAKAEETGDSGLPIPRFVSIKPSEANVRTGPGTRYPILWVYQREGIPVEIIEEFEHWRRIRDIEGAVGWVHKTMLSGARYAMVKAGEPRTVRSEPSEKGRPLLKVEPKVIALLTECEIGWCRIQVSGRRGWIEKEYLFGVYPKEVFN